MKRLPILIVTVVVVVVAAIGVVLSGRNDDTAPTRVGHGMMQSRSSSSPEGWDYSWGPMMSGPGMMGWGLMGSGLMGSALVADEPEYLTEMVAHHREAVAAARQLARSDRPQMRAFGESIVETQSAQIEQMTAWLAEWYPELAPAVDYRPMMRELSGLSGDALDRAFQQDMVGHHMVAVMMSQHLLWRGTDHEDVGDLARSIRDEQYAEILQMQRWLAQWFDTDWRGMGMGGGMGWGMGWDMWSERGREMGPRMMWSRGS